ncbi:MAG: hypothetical protein SFV19_21130 [Rhodospirillaceae bacterium]|nr:hypothetical protein [Rhodospirillaceae bacterium]
MKPGGGVMSFWQRCRARQKIARYPHNPRKQKFSKFAGVCDMSPPVILESSLKEQVEQATVTRKSVPFSGAHAKILRAGLAEY